MAGKKISELDLLNGMDGNESFPVAKGGVNYRATIAMIKNWIGNATETVAGLMSMTDKQKLDGIANAATANSSDASLRDRATHTGTQSANTITGLGKAATTNVYSDLTGRPDLSLAALGAAPASHVGAAGNQAHPDATSTTSGFMPAAAYQAYTQLKQIAVSGSYKDLTDVPAVPKNLEDLGDVAAAGAADGQVLTSQGGKWVPSTPGAGGNGGSSTLAGLTDATIATPKEGDELVYSGGKWKNLQRNRIFAGYRWYVDSNSNAGSSINDYHTIGTATYTDIAASGTDFKSNYPYSQFVSAATTYSAAGNTSAKPVVKHGTGALGGFVFEALFGFDFVAGGCGFFGVSASRSQTYGSFAATDIGIGVGWNASNAATDPLQIIVGNGTASGTIAGGSGALNTVTTYRVKITMAPGATQAYVTLKDLNSGALIFDNQMVNVDLPPAATPLYSYAGVGNCALAQSVTVRLYGVACEALMPI
jgi:hypothetical protein